MKVDRASMGVSLEARAPFLTPQVTNFALNCSSQQLIGQGTRGKEILRQAMKHHLPKLVLERKKMGFGVPLHHWFQNILKEWVMERLFQGTLLKTSWFSKRGIENLLISQINNSRTIFNLLVLEAWLRENT
jgi:asparagine synthase (glutamine-hydrolysing)